MKVHCICIMLNGDRMAEGARITLSLNTQLDANDWL